MEPVFLFIVFTIISYIVLTLAHSITSTASRARRNAAQADELLTRAESKLLLDQYVEAAVLFRQALEKAQSSDRLLASEAHYGLARVAVRCGNKDEAVHALEKALHLARFWRNAKPNFEALLKRHLTELLASG